MKILRKARCLRELAEEHGLHGLYFQHVALCRRRAWLHLMGATHAARHSRVRRGLALHQTEKRPGVAPHGLGIAPDAIDFERRVVIERKGAPEHESGLPAGDVLRCVYDRRFRRSLACRGAHLRVTCEDQLSPDGGGAGPAHSRRADSRDLMAGPAPPAHRIPLCDACSCNVLCWDEEQDGHGDRSA